MDKQTVAHPDKGILFSTENKGAIKPGKNKEEIHMHTVRRSQPAKAAYRMIPTLTFWKRYNPGGSKEISGCQTLGGKEG